MGTKYDVTFRGVSAERLAMLVTAGYAKPGHGHMPHAEPEIVTPVNSRVRVADNGVEFEIVAPAGMSGEEIRASVVRGVAEYEGNIKVWEAAAKRLVNAIDKG